MYIAINIIILIIILLCVSWRVLVRKYLLGVDFFLIFFALFYPLGILRFVLGYPSVIGIDLNNYLEVLNEVSLLVFVSLLLYFLGVLTADKLSIVKRPNIIPTYLPVGRGYLRYFCFLIFFAVLYVSVKAVIFVASFGGWSIYLQNIDEYRQTLVGQMPLFLLMYFCVFYSVFLMYVSKKYHFLSYVSLGLVMLSFLAYGFRGPFIIVGMILFFLMQSMGVIRIRLGIKLISIVIALVFLFVFYQELRESTDSSDPFYIRFLARFGGYDVLTVVYQAVFLERGFDISIVLHNFISFIDLPIPREVLEDKSEPASLFFADTFFSKIGDREFSTGGISPTIVGSIIWNFNIYGVAVLYFLGFFMALMDGVILYSRSILNRTFFIGLQVYFILCVEAPENSLGYLWFLFISIFIVFIFDVFLKGRIFNEYSAN